MNLTPFLPSRHLRCRALLLSYGLTASVGLFAQTTAPETKDDEMVRLTPFEVSSGSAKGYMSAETTTGTRYAAPIKDIPFSVQVVTSEFLEDFLAVDFSGQEAMSYSSSYSPINGGSTGAYTMRGVKTFSEYKNGILEGGVYGPVSVDRIEIVKGPNAAVYGATEPTGLRNIVTKKAKSTPQADLRVSFGSDDFSRTVLDLNTPIIPHKFEIRFDASYDRSAQFYEKFAHLWRQNYYSSNNWYIGENTKLVTDVEYIKVKSFGQNNLPYVLNATGQTVGYFGSGTYENLANFNTTGPNGFNKVEYTQIDSTLTHKFNDRLSLLLFGSRYTRNQEVLRLNNGTTYSEKTGAIGKYTASAGLTAGDRTIDIELNHQYQYNAQAQLLGQFTLGPTTHKILAAADWYLNDAYALKNFYGNTQGKTVSLQPLALSNTIYYNDPSNPTFNPIFDVANTTTWNVPNQLTDTQQVDKGVMISERAGLFGDRLLLFIGGRHDQIDYSQVNWLTTKQVVDYPSKTGNTIQSAALYEITPSLSAFANFSQSFIAQNFTNTALVDYYGNPLGLITGNGVEAGIKVSAFEQRLNFTFDAYSIVRHNVPFNATDIFGNTLKNVLGNNYSLTADQKSKGVELDFNWLATQNLVLLGGVGYNDARYKNIPPSASQNLLNTPPYLTPHVSSGVAARYNFDQGFLNGFSLQSTYHYQGKAMVSATVLDPNGRYFYNHPYSTFDFGAGYQWKTRKFQQSVGIDVKNIFNEKYLVGLTPGAPTEVMGSLTVKF